jgi:hypothetical protein
VAAISLLNATSQELSSRITVIELSKMSQDKIREIELEAAETSALMRENIDTTIDRGVSIESIMLETAMLEENTKIFAKESTSFKWQTRAAVYAVAIGCLIALALGLCVLGFVLYVKSGIHLNTTKV